MKPFFVVVITTLLLGCAKTISESDTVPSRRYRFLTVGLTSPRDGQSVSPGQPVSIIATITNDAQLEKVRLVVSNKGTGAEVLRLEKYLDVKTYTLSESFTPEAGRRYTIRVEAWDQHNNKAETQIGVIGD